MDIGREPFGKGSVRRQRMRSRGSGPAMVSRRSAKSRGVRAIGPLVANWCRKTSPTGSDGTRPKVGRKPYTLQKAAGFRSEPMKSEPSATATSRAASAAAAPPLEPPALRERS